MSRPALRPESSDDVAGSPCPRLAVCQPPRVSTASDDARTEHQIDLEFAMKYLRLMLLSCLLVCSTSMQAAVPQTETETPQQKAARMQWWADARFGMFIHWGLYAVPAGEWNGRKDLAEWFMDQTGIPRAEYEKFAAQFNPTQYDPDAWVRIAKDAGMKYIVITSKHHEGFAMWDTKGTDYNIVKRTPYAKGVLKPLAEAARRAGLHFGTYYSIMDWHDPSQSPAEPGKHYNPTRIDPQKKRAYIAEMKTELAELVHETHTDVLWFDGEWVDWWTNEDGRELYTFLRDLDPNLIINNRVGNSRNGLAGMNKGAGVGDFGTPEQNIPARGFGPGVYWETCMTLNDHWGYNHYDNNWKSPTVVVQNLVDIASKGGNYLLNVGPTAQGEIPPGAVSVLADVGRWMQVNGAAIYATTASPFETKFDWGRVTQGPGKLYLHVFAWPKTGTLSLPIAHAQQAYALVAPDKPLAIRSAVKEVIIELPKQAPDTIDSVIVVQTDGAAQAH
jgi:alpha-L-fucosidase